jgi:hypothetical protein
VFSGAAQYYHHLSASHLIHITEGGQGASTERPGVNRVPAVTRHYLHYL